MFFTKTSIRSTYSGAALFTVNNIKSLIAGAFLQENPVVIDAQTIRTFRGRI